MIVRPLSDKYRSDFSSFIILANVSFEVPVKAARSALDNIISTGHLFFVLYFSVSITRFNRSLSLTVRWVKFVTVFTHTVNSMLRNRSKVVARAGERFNKI